MMLLAPVPLLHLAITWTSSNQPVIDAIGAGIVTVFFGALGLAIFRMNGLMARMQLGFLKNTGKPFTSNDAIADVLHYVPLNQYPF